MGDNLAEKITISICSKGYTTHIDGVLGKSEVVNTESGSGGLLTILYRALQGIASKTDLGTLVIESSNSHMEKWILDDVAAPPKQYADQIFKVQKVLDLTPVTVVFRHKKVTTAELRLKSIFPTKSPEGESLADAFADFD